MAMIREIPLRLSGLLVQWRADDGYSRITAPPGGTPLTRNITAWQPCAGADTIFAASGAASDDADPWWAVWGTCPPSATDVVVVLPDGSTPAVGRADRLWAAEWAGQPRSVRVRIGKHEAAVPFEVPSFMGSGGPTPRTGRISAGWAQFVEP
ncbi:hypothetical protein AB0L57_00445 [Nocardia sp. NPDC052254]|uniref:hypothetical protein n=1 Tax=Nocardia sp. NPDC052254 TaxID=3155681 RepID=UPI00341568EB